MPTANALTDHKCRNAQPGTKDQKLFDGHGLFLFVSKTGAKTWRWTYRLSGKAQTHSIGPYPLVSLQEARTRRDALRLRHLNGEDVRVKVPVKQRISFDQAVRTFWAARRDVSDEYRAGALRAYGKHLQPALGDKPIADITRANLLATLMVVDGAGHHVYARRLKMWTGLAFDWAVEHGHAAVNLAALIRADKAFGKRPVKHHPSLRLAEVAEFMQKLNQQPEVQSVLACRMLALTWVRTGELRQMEWTEIEGDTWRIPAEKMKMKREHLVPLSPPAVAILTEMKRRARGNRYVWPCGHAPLENAMSENSILRLIDRMGYAGRMTGHGWRTVASTWANEHEYNPDAIELQLAHDEANSVRAAYNGAQYLSQRRAMLNDYGQWLMSQGLK
jgi:integrase